MTKGEKVAAVLAAVLLPGGAIAGAVWWWMRRDRSQLDARDLEKLGELSDRFRPMAEKVLRSTRAAGLSYFLGDAYRSNEKSAQLFAEYKAGGPRAAPPGESAHNFHEALDVNLTDENGNIIQTVDAPEYQKFAGIVRASGAVWGGDFKSGPKDGPHLEHPDWRELRDASSEAVS